MKIRLKARQTPASNHIVLKVPIYLTVAYLIFTLIVYVLCPYHWPTKKPVLFWTLNILYIIAIFGGYILGLKYRIRFKWIEWTEKKTKKLMRFVSILSVINFFMYIIYIFRVYGFSTFDFPGLWKQMCIGFQNPGLGYSLHQSRIHSIDGANVLGGTFYTFLSLLFSFFKNSTVILSFLYFKKLTIYGKISSIMYIIILILFYFSIGTNIQILHVFLLLELPQILKFFESWYNSKKFFVKNFIKLIIFFSVGLLIVMLYFNLMLTSRHTTNGVEATEYSIGGLTPNPADNVNTSISSDSIPTATDKMTDFWISASSYLSQGYYGMSQALTLPWIPMYGVGNSMFLINMISKHIYDVDQYTYQVRLEPLGWDSDVRWHSIYTWIANDVSFYGVVLVMFIIGYLFGMMFKDAITIGNPFAKASIFFFILLLIFIPCNNQIAQTNENLCSFLLLIGLWMASGKMPKQRMCEKEIKKQTTY